MLRIPFMLILSGIILSFQTAVAQVSIAYTDITILVERMPEMTEANRLIDQLKDQLSDELKGEQLKLSAKFKEYQELSQLPNPTEEQKAQMAALENELGKMDKEINEMASKFDQQLTVRKDELQTPIFQKVEKVVEEVAKKNNVDCILSKTNSYGVSVILYAPDKAEFTLELANALNVEVKGLELKPFSVDPSAATIGYTNVEMILSVWPVMGIIEKQLEAYQAELAEEAANGGNVEELEQKLVERREKLMAPKLEELQAVIDKVAAEQGFNYILNQSVSSGLSTILSGPENGDITFLIMKELGIKSATEGQPVVAKKGVTVGYMNVEALLVTLPESLEIQKQLEAETEELTKKAQTLYNYLREQFAATMQKMDKVAPGSEEYKALETEAKKIRQEMDQVSVDFDTDVAQRQSKLMMPLLDKIQKAIDEVAASEGFTYVLNQTTALNIVWMDSDHDITDKVEARLK